MRFVYQEVETGLEEELLNAEVCADRIVQVGCICLR